MRVSITFSGNVPRISVGNLEGILMQLWGRTEHVFSKDPTDDTIATWFDFFIEQINGGWGFTYCSNRVYSQESEKVVLDTLLANANEAIQQRKATDLSNDFNALNSFEPFIFGGLFAHMDERHNPILENGDRDQVVEGMRKELKSCLTLDEIKSDIHLRNFVLKIPSEIIWVDHTSSNE